MRGSSQPRWFAALSLNWRCRRYSWRFAFLYARLFWALLVAIVATFVLHVLVRRVTCKTFTSCGVYENYECSAASIRWITNSMAAVAGFWVALATACYAQSRLLHAFLDLGMKDLLEAGVWSVRLVMLSNGIQYFIALLHVAWLLFNVIFLTVIAAGKMCSTRLTEAGLQAVRNCRAYFTYCCRTSNCSPWSFSDRFQCNSLNFLGPAGFLVDTSVPGSTAKLCALGHVASAAAAAGRQTQAPPEEFAVPKTDSDFYKVILFWTFASLMLSVMYHTLFQLIKRRTPIETHLYEAKASDRHFLWRVLEVFTPN